MQTYTEKLSLFDKTSGNEKYVISFLLIAYFFRTPGPHELLQDLVPHSLLKYKCHRTRATHNHTQLKRVVLLNRVAQRMRMAHQQQ